MQSSHSVESLENFRLHARLWLEENCPVSMRVPFTDLAEEVWGGRNAVFKNPDSKLWLERMVSKGWTAPTWPTEFGGAGLSSEEAAILDQELTRLNCRIALKSFDIWMLGPVLLRYGNDKQKAEFLPGIARGETRWCQGYSEPSAGSDLASLQTRAELDGDHYIVNGQKIWTSHADKADWMFCLVRTSFDGPKHDGISFLLIDMKSPGISVRPIQLISGSSPFCETFFENVRVPARNLIGNLNQGWTIAKTLLEHERAMISKIRDVNAEDNEPLESIAKRYTRTLEDGTLADSDLRTRVTRVNMDIICNRLTLRRAADTAQAGRPPGSETSMFKYYGTELNKRRKDLIVQMAGFHGIGQYDDETSDEYSPKELTRTRDWLRSRANSIEGGSSEIQLNIIAKRVLQLPD